MSKANKMSSGLPTPPTEEYKPVLSSRRTSTKTSKSSSSSRGSKRHSASLAHEPREMIIDGRHKRVWKACERCRMKKTKCDGESPCKRCKDDGLVCTAGSRKKTEFKQLPRGYAEVLENTQYALIATVQKLYTMVRNGESWTLGEPELNDRGLPVIHHIAEKLGCIRPSPDMPASFPEDADEFDELRRRLFAGAFGGDESKDCDEQAGSSSCSGGEEGEPGGYGDMEWEGQPQRQQQQNLPAEQFPLDCPPFDATDDNAFPATATTTPAATHTSILTPQSTYSPLFRSQSPLFDWSPTAASAATDDIFAVDLSSLYMRQQAQQCASQGQSIQQNFKSSLQALRIPRVVSSGLRSPVETPVMGGWDGTIRPGMLECSSSVGMGVGVDYGMYGTGEYAGMGVASSRRFS